MPNHIKNIIRLECESEEQLKSILDSIKVDNFKLPINTLDFNKVIPMPKSLMLESSSDTTKGIRLCLTRMDPNVSYYGEEDEKLNEEVFDKLKELASKRLFWNNGELVYPEKSIDELVGSEEEKKLINLGKQALDNLIKYNHFTWYSWSYENWNTKWNAYDFREFENNTIEFSTAWEPPIPVLLELTNKYPELTLEHYYTDEIVGYHCGYMVYKNGNVVFDETCLDGSKRAVDIGLFCYHESADANCLIASYDNSCYIETDTKFESCTINDNLCLTAFEPIKLSQIPGGYYTYFVVNDCLCNFYTTKQTGCVISPVPLACDKNGICKIHVHDLIHNGEMISIEDFKNSYEQAFVQKDDDFTIIKKEE